MLQVSVHRGSLESVQAETLVVNLFEGLTEPTGATKAIDAALDGAIKALIEDGQIKGKAGEFTTIHTFGRLAAKRVVVAGLGKPDAFNLDRVRSLAADLARFLQGGNGSRAASVVFGAGAGGLDPEKAAQAMTEGARLGTYRFQRRLTTPGENPELTELLLVESDEAKAGSIERGTEAGRILAEGTAFARDLANEPANFMTPTILAQQAAEMASREGLECEIFDRERLELMGMGGLLGVAQGSQQPPKFIVLRYRGDLDSTRPTIGLIGKGITFDSGGISIKPAENMDNMKGDMAGGASVIAALQAIARHKPRVNVTGLVPATENLPSGSAYKPGDVVKALNGKTIEVLNTDAEGRVILADALSYAVQQGLSPLIDVATLTGACVVALGTVCSGGFTNDQATLDKVIAAGAAAGEKIWQLPLFDEYQDQIKGDWGDIKNTGGREAGAITAAAFLSHFVGETPWVHLDIAGTARTKSQKGWLVKGHTGVPVRTLVNFVLTEATGQG